MAKVCVGMKEADSVLTEKTHFLWIVLYVFGTDGSYCLYLCAWALCQTNNNCGERQQMMVRKNSLANTNGRHSTPSRPCHFSELLRTAH
ncbi:unnamed protein product [Larinioides sclopetarius]|uniref:Uncharacterized protein n=1 Tax=Larinioides sclopetarius TaxID=280406 RepID=A0AAV1ZS00_9ARAC